MIKEVQQRVPPIFSLDGVVFTVSPVTRIKSYSSSFLFSSFSLFFRQKYVTWLTTNSTNSTASPEANTRNAPSAPNASMKKPHMAVPMPQPTPKNKELTPPTEIKKCL